MSLKYQIIDREKVAFPEKKDWCTWERDSLLVIIGCRTVHGFDLSGHHIYEQTLDFMGFGQQFGICRARWTHVTPHRCKHKYNECQLSVLFQIVGVRFFYMLGSQLPSCEYLEIFLLLAHHSAWDVKLCTRLCRKLLDEQGIIPESAVSWAVPPALLLSVKCRHQQEFKVYLVVCWLWPNRSDMSCIIICESVSVCI